MSNVTEQTLDLIKQAHSTNNDAIQKSITTSNNLAAYDLQAPAKNLYPVQTPIRNTLPRTTGIGTATNWRTIAKINGSGWDGSGWVPEGQRSGVMSYVVESLSASFKTLGEEDNATYEAINAGRGFEDIRARMTMRLLQKLMLKEESAILGGNSSFAVASSIASVAPTLSKGATGGTIPADTYFVRAVALTYEGYRNSSVIAGSSINGIANQKTVTGADGDTYPQNGGSSVLSNSASIAVTLGETLKATIAVQNGAFAYAWFVGLTATASDMRLQAITTVNAVELTAYLTTTQTGNYISANTTQNPYAFNGLLYQGLTSAVSSSTGAYLKTMPVNTTGGSLVAAGTPLTSSGRGSVEEIDDMLINMWNNNQLSPTVIYCNAQEIRNISKKVLTGASAAPMVRYNVGENASSMQLAASPFVDTYFNPITKQPLRIEVHPNVPPGTILAWADDLPAQYQSSEVPNVAEVRARQDYYQIDWPVTTRKQSVGVYCEEVLVCYAPFAIGIITNIGNG